MMALADRVGRNEAHHLVHELATEAMRSEMDFASVLRADKCVTEHLSPAEIESLTDPKNYTGMAESLVEQTLE